MIFLWFSRLGQKLPFILQNGSQNCILSVRMNVSRKSKTSEWFQNFYHFRTSTENFSVFWQNFSTELSKQPSTCPERTSEKKTIWRLFQFCIICGQVAFFWFLARIFRILLKMWFGCPEECLQKFLSAENFFFYPFLILSRNCLTSDLVFFRRKYRKCILSSRRKIMDFPGTF